MNIRNCGVLKSSENFVVIQERIKYLPQTIVFSFFFLSRRFHSKHLNLFYSVCTLHFNEILPSHLNYCYEFIDVNWIRLLYRCFSKVGIISLYVLFWLANSSFNFYATTDAPLLEKLSVILACSCPTLFTAFLIPWFALGLPIDKDWEI